MSGSSLCTDPPQVIIDRLKEEISYLEVANRALNREVRGLTLRFCETTSGTPVNIDSFNAKIIQLARQQEALLAEKEAELDKVKIDAKQRDKLQHNVIRILRKQVKEKDMKISLLEEEVAKCDEALSITNHIKMCNTFYKAFEEEERLKVANNVSEAEKSSNNKRHHDSEDNGDLTKEEGEVSSKKTRIGECDLVCVELDD